MLQRQLGNVGYMPGSGIVYLLQCALVACSSQWPGSIAGSIVLFVQFFIHSHAEIARGMEIMRRSTRAVQMHHFRTYQIISNIFSKIQTILLNK